MPAIDRALLRIGRLRAAGPARRARRRSIINEAVELAKRYSTDDSGRFVNGMLSKLAEQLRGA